MYVTACQMYQTCSACCYNQQKLHYWLMRLDLALLAFVSLYEQLATTR